MKKSPVIPLVRKLKFPLQEEGARNWFGNQAISDLFHGLSVFFPLGERHFIETVRPFVDQIRDPELKEKVSAFVKQEAYHSREHDRYNQLLAKLGYPVAHLEARVRERIGLAKKYLDARRQLAGTCALEHFTAVVADGMLSAGDGLFKDADPRFAALWRWHAIEELEHKAVAYDVYQEVGGRYLERARSMLLVTIFFGHSIVVHVNAMMRADGIDPLEGWAQIRKLLFTDTQAGWRMLRSYVAYYRRDFHPWDHANQHFIEEWNRNYDALVKDFGLLERV